MPNYYSPTVVNPPIPADCMAPLEMTLLGAIFDHEADGDGVYFFAEESPKNYTEFDVGELRKVIDESRTICPDLCALAEKELADSTGNRADFDLDTIGHEIILQGIVARHPDRLPWVDVTSSLTCSKMAPDGFGGCVTLITPTEIIGTSTQEWLHEQLKQRGLG